MADPLTLALVFVVGLAAGFGSGLFGIGGGTLMVPAVIYLVPGTTFHAAKAASLLVISLATLVGIQRHRHHGNVDLRRGLLLGVGGVLGTVAASYVAEATAEGVLKGAFGVFLAGTGVRMWWAVQPRPHHPSGAVRLATYLGFGFLAGLAVGFFGVGGGILMVPALVFLGCGIHLAVGTSLVAVLVNGVAGTVTHAYLGYWGVMIALGVPLALGSVVGIRFGTDYATRLHADRLRRAFAVFLVLMGMYMAFDGFGPDG